MNYFVGWALCEIFNNTAMRQIFTLSILLLVTCGLRAQTGRPTAAQQVWHEREFYLFLHFGPNTFTDKEWGHGDESESLFNPTQLDCEQWCRIAKAAGARGLIITAKHHDGFCLWPSAYSTHTVRESPWKNGKGDVLAELSAACRKHGLVLGFYLSPWDRNHPQYGTPEYNDVYINTMTELMTRYGKLFEFWWDGANGEGPNGKKQVYDFKRFEKVAAKLQPKAVIFSDIGPGCRWVGNENGIVGETNWGTLDTAGFTRGAGGPPYDSLFHGNFNGKTWIPAECDVSIRPGWFYHKEEDEKVKTPEQLMHIWLNSVGHGANLLLNVPPDRRGLIHENDSAALMQFAALRRQYFGKNLVADAQVQTGPRKQPKLHDGKPETASELLWKKGDVITVQWKQPQQLRYVQLKEYLPEGNNVTNFVIDIWDAEAKTYRQVGASTSIGPRKMIPLPENTRSDQIRVRLLGARRAKVRLAEIEVF